MSIELIERIKNEPNIKLGEKTERTALVECRRDLSRMKIPVLPSEIAEIIVISNGLKVNGLDIFGINSQNEPLTSDIIDENKKISQNPKWQKNTLLIAKSDDYLVGYCEDSETYEIFDKNDLCFMGSYDGFASLLIDLIEKAGIFC